MKEPFVQLLALLLLFGPVVLTLPLSIQATATATAPTSAASDQWLPKKNNLSASANHKDATGTRTTVSSNRRTVRNPFQQRTAQLQLQYKQRTKLVQQPRNDNVKNDAPRMAPPLRPLLNKPTYDDHGDDVRDLIVDEFSSDYYYEHDASGRSISGRQEYSYSYSWTSPDEYDDDDDDEEYSRG